MAVRLVWGAIVVLAGAVLALPATAGAAAAPGADLRPEVRSGHAAVGQVAKVQVAIHNFGPNPVPAGEAIAEITAPGGTVFGPYLEQLSHSRFCQVLTAHRRARCVGNSTLYVDGHGENGAAAPDWGTFDFTIADKCVTPGSFRVVYGADTRRSNNSAAIVVRVDGVDARACRHPSASAKASPTAKASPSASIAGTPSPEAVVEPDPPTADEPSTATVLTKPTGGDGGGISYGIVIGAIAVLAGLGLLGGVLWRGRRADDDADE